jgi:hypothetical protein
LTDAELLDRATELARVLFSNDKDLIVEARRRQRDGMRFTGVVFASQKLAIGSCVEHLELLAKAAEPEDLADLLLFLPFR